MLALSILTAALLAAPSPATKPKRLAVLPTILEGSSGSATNAEVFQAGAKSAERFYEFDVIPYNEVIVDEATSVFETARDCASDANCIARALSDRNIQAGLRIIINYGIDPPLVSLSLIEQGPKRVTAEAVTEIPKPTELAAELEKASLALLESAGYSKAGRIFVTVTPPDATVRVEGEARATKDPHVFLVRAGRFDVVAERADYQTARTNAVVTSGDDAKVALVLEKTPVVAEDGFPWLWVAIGTAVAAGTATAIVIAADPFTSDPARGCVCITTANGDCTKSCTSM